MSEMCIGLHVKCIGLHVKCIGLHVKCLSLLSDFNETLNFSTDFSKNNQNIKFHETPSSEDEVVPCGQTDRQTDRHDEANSHSSEHCERA